MATNVHATPDLSYTYPGIVGAEIFYSREGINPVPTREMFTIRTGVRSKEQLHTLTPISNIVKKNPGCTPNRQNIGKKIEDVTLETFQVNVSTAQCWDVFQNTIFETKLKLGIDKPDLTGTDLDRIITAQLQDAMRRDNFRILSFANQAYSNSDLNQIDGGLWPKLLAGVPSYCTYVGNVISSLNQTANTRAYDYLKNLYEGAPIELRQLDNSIKRFFVTPNVYYNYLTYLETTSGVQGAWTLLQDGTQTLTFRGIPVVKVDAWENIINNYALNPEYNTLMLYTTPLNHIVGLEDQTSMEQITAFYDRRYRDVLYDGMYRMGYNYVDCLLNAISYGNV